MARVISFTRNGNNLNYLLCEKMNFQGFSVLEDERLTKTKLKDWVQQGFAKKQCMIFIGAAGIAVRSIAPYVHDKLTDPSVIVIDEKAEFVIPILSGHVGGGNAMSKKISKVIGGRAVITTATDVNNLFAVDLFAQRNGLTIKERELAKKISAEIINGKEICFCSDEKLQGTAPKYLTEKDSGKLGFLLSIYRKDYFQETLHLIPKAVILGIGCKRGTREEEIKRGVMEALDKDSIDILSVAEVATIDIKKNEQGLLDFCKNVDICLRFFSANELNRVEGNFTISNFVKQTTGVDNVCERAAICAGGEKLIIRKTAGNGVTVAVAVKNWGASFE